MDGREKNYQPDASTPITAVTTNTFLQPMCIYKKLPKGTASTVATETAPKIIDSNFVLNRNAKLHKEPLNDIVRRLNFNCLEPTVLLKKNIET